MEKLVFSIAKHGKEGLLASAYMGKLAEENGVSMENMEFRTWELVQTDTVGYSLVLGANNLNVKKAFKQFVKDYLQTAYNSETGQDIDVEVLKDEQVNYETIFDELTIFLTDHVSSFKTLKGASFLETTIEDIDQKFMKGSIEGKNSYVVVWHGEEGESSVVAVCGSYWKANQLISERMDKDEESEDIHCPFSVKKMKIQ